MTQAVNRRHFLRTGALALVAGMGGVGCRHGRRERAAAASDGGQWSGIGFGIEMQAQWSGSSGAADVGNTIERTIQQLEAAFSLYSDQSELSRLNQSRVLESASPVFLSVLAQSRQLVERTGGLFQPALRKAWEQRDDRSLRAGLLRAADMRFVETDGRSVRVTNPDTELSFNALVQGLLADRVAESMQRNGVRSALLQLGENRAIGEHPDGRPWMLGVSGEDGAGEPGLVGLVEFADAGMAVSAVRPGAPWLHPLTGRMVDGNRVVAVVSREGAAVADAFATAFAVGGGAHFDALVEALGQGGDYQVMVWEDARLVFESGDVLMPIG
ncbi:FAD:protein FMN transferase [Sulfuriroseicoccus oceanibius]|uniref:FAD:protein FMN transferase n=1 Tax=Sulfuriroseicoccus oceanibius TaxID=2707525 RepID=A0A6B3L9M1_9BACT|nr:FAD:protein FMN transferase [Sulfuriroseicoccus oceanibius]QQL44159.1 FAD:protein FMN transferase [Sulfuriroseicoccus oceanibius]